MGLSGAMIGDIKDNAMLVDWHELFLQIARANGLFLCTIFFSIAAKC